jgi:hypothetical protein
MLSCRFCEGKTKNQTAEADRKIPENKIDLFITNVFSQLFLIGIQEQAIYSTMMLKQKERLYEKHTTLDREIPKNQLSASSFISLPVPSNSAFIFLPSSVNFAL